jgi:glycosyltransferase-like protein
MKPLRIALLTHSTNPRGGVAHTLAVAESLHDLGHAVTVFAPGTNSRGFPRLPRCRASLIPARRVDGSLLDLVERRVAEYVAHFEHYLESFDIYHAQDGISGNALATLAERGLIDGFVRTVHHLDDFSDPYLSELQDRSVMAARLVLCVSQLWAGDIQERYGLPAAVVFNGVDVDRFSPTPTARDVILSERLGLGLGPIFLSVGGVEARKNSIHLLQAFARFHADFPSASLVIAGGASLLDHGAYRAAFDATMACIGEATRSAVVYAGIIAEEEMPALMRKADVLVFPSIKEGFGLVVLEAMSCGTPTVVSRIAPFTEYLADGDCAWCDPFDVASITAAMHRAIADRARLRERGFAVAKRFPWIASAKRHEGLYLKLLQEKGHAANAVSSALA